MDNYLKLKSISDKKLEDSKSYRHQRYFLTDLKPISGIITIIRGLRGIGKTISLLQYMNSLTANRLYISVDNILLDGTLMDLASEFASRGGGVLALDEIHKYSNWRQEVKNIVDSYSSIQLILSGSSSLEIKAQSVDLSRRHQAIAATGLSFREFLNFKYDFNFSELLFEDVIKNKDIVYEVIHQLGKKSLNVRDVFNDYLRIGFFPTSLHIPQLDVFEETLRNGIAATIEIDIPSVHRNLSADSVKNLKRLFVILGGLCPYTPNITKLRGQLGIADPVTLKQYLNFLHQAHVLYNLFPKNKSPDDLFKPEKIYLSNTNFVYALNSQPNIGNIRETFAVSALQLKHRLLAPKKGDLLVDDQYTLEIGGKNKKHDQIKGLKNSYILVDVDLTAEAGQIPLWALGFDY